jgi:acyl-CoA synthetase (AMP-forming)/AMP-acid ligase II
MTGEQLVIVVHPEQDHKIDEELRVEIVARNRRLLNYKRISGIVPWERDFPRTAALKIKRNVLAEEIRQALESTAVIPL